jgi:hypothetical protein
MFVAMLLGQILFILAALGIAGATAVGLVYGIVKVVLYKITGRALKPLPEPGSSEWLLTDTLTRVDMARPSLLTERTPRTTRDPVVSIASDRYRVTRLNESRFLVTHVAEGRRLGTFELDGNGRFQEVLPQPDDPANAKLLVQIAVVSSFVRRTAA